MVRSFRAPGYPYIPAVALILAILCLGAMLWFQPVLGLAFALMMLLGYGYFLLTKAQRRNAPHDAMLADQDPI
jgi:ethanolamine permease